MQRFHRHLLRLAHQSSLRSTAAGLRPLSSRSTTGAGDGDDDDGAQDRRRRHPAPDVGWAGELGDPSWSIGLSRDEYAGPVLGRWTEAEAGSETDLGPREVRWEEEMEKGKRKDRAFVDGWEERYRETCELMKQVKEPGARGAYLKEEEKAEMYRLHRKDPGEYTVERLARDFRVLRQRVHAVLWLKEMEEEEERRSGRKLDDSVEKLLDECPEFFISHDREFHVASLPYKPDFKVMPVDWDGKTKDPDEVLYEISTKEDEMLYQEFVLKMNFNKKKMAGEVYHHKYSRRRSPKGWNFTIEKLGMQDKCRSGNAFRFVSLPDGSSRELNELEKMYARRERPQRRRRILP